LKFVSITGERRVVGAVQQLLRGTHIGEGGRDQGKVRAPYSQLEVAHVWRMDNPLVQDRYALEVCAPLRLSPMEAVGLILAELGIDLLLLSRILPCRYANSTVCCRAASAAPPYALQAACRFVQVPAYPSL
jgi:hypothetical protein